jgi:hypothetical protein
MFVHYPIFLYTFSIKICLLILYNIHQETKEERNPEQQHHEQITIQFLSVIDYGRLILWNMIFKLIRL